MVTRSGSLLPPHARALGRVLLALGLALALLAGSASLVQRADAASATTNRIFKDFQADGEIDACDFSATQLRTARSEVQDDIEAYSPDFLDALDDALAARSNCGGGGSSSGSSSGGGSGGSGGSGSGSGGVSTLSPGGTGSDLGEGSSGASPSAGAGSTSDAGSGTSEGAASTPTPGPTAVAAPQAADDAVLAAASRPADDGSGAWIWAVVAGVVALLLLAAWLVRWSGWEPRWVAPATHSIEEAGWRIGNRWSEFGDWMKRGR